MARASDQPYLPDLHPDARDQQDVPVAQVAPLTFHDRVLSYTIPGELIDRLAVGQRVEVPLGRGNRQAVAYCIDVTRRPWKSTLKPVHKILDDEPLLDAALIELGTWMSRYYCCPLGRVLAAMVPESVRGRSGYRKIRVARLLKPLSEIEQEAQRISAKQRQVLASLTDCDDPVPIETLCEALGCTAAPVRSAAKRGWVEINTIRRPKPGPSFDRPGEEPDIRPNADQSQALLRIRQALQDGRFRVHLLFGVAGSGKTEVYVRAIRDAVGRGKQAIMLVPEIALTTQLVDRLARRFSNLAVIHSGLTGSQRSLVWADIAAGRKRVVIGTRSAIFAPTRELGLIVVDEEQDSSYENLQSPRFNSRDVAVVRASQAGIPIVLGSATPSLETWYNAERLPHYERIDLPRRVAGLPMPRVQVIDMREQHRQGPQVQLLSQTMERELRSALDQHQQAVLLMNRRGYSSAVFCPRCGWSAVCPDCDTRMVYHQTSGELKCHRCSRRQPLRETCPDDSCGGTPLRFGMGTERVEEEVRRKFPQARLARADSDTMRRTELYEDLIQRFERGDIDVLVGTQMVAKGLDFPLVSFVGVINADTSMAASDFRAAERTFQLVTQVAGRAGRARGRGTVIVQTEAPELPAIRLAVDHDYAAFARQELEARKRLRLPPVWRMTRIVLSDTSDSKAREQAGALAQIVRDAAITAGTELVCDGPEPCPIHRQRKLYRYELLLRAPTAEQMQRVLDRVRGKPLQSIRVKRIVVDVDPLALS